MVCETRQSEEQTQFAVVIFRGTELLQGMETLDCFLHGELQLKNKKRNVFQTHTEKSFLSEPQKTHFLSPSEHQVTFKYQ